jgi:VWFA-related protein
MPIARFPAAAALFFSVCSPARAQTAPPVTAGPDQTRNSVGKAATIKTNVRQVVLVVVVTDENGQPVKGLTQQDFSVIENNVPQKFVYFEAHNSAPDSSNVNRSAIPTLPPDTFLNVSATNEHLPLNILRFDALNTPLNDQSYAFQEVIRFLRMHSRAAVGSCNE